MRNEEEEEGGEGCYRCIDRGVVVVVVVRRRGGGLTDREEGQKQDRGCTDTERQNGERKRDNHRRGKSEGEERKKGRGIEGS